MLANANQNWMIWLNEQTKVTLTGTASPDFLRSGLYVSFTADLDKRGFIKDKVSQLTIFTPTNENGVGVFPGTSTVGGENEGPGAAGGFAPKAGGKVGKAASKVAAATMEGQATIAGQVTAAKNSKLTVNAGGRTFKFDLADDAKIDVKVADYTSFARKGDKITVDGKTYPNTTGVGLAAVVKIEAAAPFGSGKAKAPPRTPTRTPKKKQAAAP
jgi:hypothetical protein